MKQLYLLGFIRSRTDLPSEAPLWTKLTRVGEHGIIWCDSPKEMFNSKQDFLWAMLQWFEQIQQLGITVLPIQSGVSTSNEAHLVDLLNTYQKELGLCFAKVDGCSEYCLTVVHKSQGSIQLSYPPLRENVQSGKEYLNRLRVRNEFLEREILRARELVEDFSSYFTPWLKESRFEIPRTRGTGINLNFLVPNVFKKEYVHKLQSLSDNPNWTIDWTGPWPPFHFSSLSLKPERFLRRESLQWVNRGGLHD